MMNLRVRRWLPLSLLLAIVLASFGGSFTCYASSGDPPPSVPVQPKPHP